MRDVRARAFDASAMRSRPHATAAMRSTCSSARAAVSIFCSPISACRSWTASRCRSPRRATYPDLTILLMTGYADQRERAHGLDALIHDVIPKPFTLAALRGAVDEALTVKAR